MNTLLPGQSCTSYRRQFDRKIRWHPLDRVVCLMVDKTVKRINLVPRLADWQIRERSLKSGMITPFEEGIARPGKISYGVTSYGYDMRLGRSFRIFTNAHCGVVDPKQFDEKAFIPHEGDTCLIPPNSFILGESFETFDIPRDIISIVLGKSTYARSGLVINVTPMEPCLSDDTDVLTDSGWRSIAEVQVGQQVLTRREDGVAVYGKVQERQKYRYSGSLLHFHGKAADQLVTSDHKMFVRDGEGNARTITAELLYGRPGFSLDRAVDWVGKRLPDYYTVGDMSFPKKAFLKFMGVFLADGVVSQTKDGRYEAAVGSTSSAHADAAMAALLDMGVEALMGRYEVVFHRHTLCEYLHEFLPRWERRIPRNFLVMTPAECGDLLDGLVMKPSPHEPRTLDTFSRGLADDVQELALKAGQSAVVQQTRSTCNGAAYNSWHVKVFDSEARVSEIRAGQHEHIPYDGYVYDVTVPNHVFLCRRNGKASWTGNCWRGKLTIEISNTTPLPAKVYAGEGIAQAIFLQGDEECEIDYQQKKGKYQDQVGLTLPKVDK